MSRKRYALCGLSTRAIYQFVLPLTGKSTVGGPAFDDRSALVGILDTDRVRVEAFLEKVGLNVPFFPGDAVERMLATTQPDVLIVAGPDFTHCDQIVTGLEAGCDVIVEKPMVINCQQVQRVQEAERVSGRRVRVAHNYRYAPVHKRLKRMIMGGELGRIVNVEFTYNLDTWHGSSYFYRWNRLREMSGGLSVHKCCHHFDLVNWWLDDIPDEVFAFGGLNYYGPHGTLCPRDASGRRLPPAEEKRQCPVFDTHYAGKVDPESNWISTNWDEFGLPYEVQYPSEKRRYIYDDEIQIEDTYSAVIRYRRGATVAYSCNFCTPWEGYLLAMNGTKGRVEIVHRSDPNPTGKSNPAGNDGLITFYPLFGGKQLIEIPGVAGGHGGADFAIQHDLLGGMSEESRDLELVAGSRAGGYSIAVGEGCWRSIDERRPIKIAELLEQGIPATTSV